MGRYVFKLPDVGEGTAEAELVGWHVKVGDRVEEDQILADIMTDKATVELTSPVAGTVTAAHGEPGQQLAVGSPLVEFEVEGAGNAAASDGGAAPSVSAQERGATSPHSGEVKADQSSPPHAGGEGDRGAVEGAAQPPPSGANYVFKLPDVGEGTAEAELAGWHVKVGDAVEEDQIIADIMTDKATVELTSPVAGTVVALHGEPGQQLAVGGPLVSFAVEGKGNVAASVPASAPSTASRSPSPVSLRSQGRIINDPRRPHCGPAPGCERTHPRPRRGLGRDDPAQRVVGSGFPG